MNILDYLYWRSDVPFSAAPFNEVDDLILSELAYTDFSGILPETGAISLSDARDAFFAKTSREEILARSGFTAKAPLLLDAMASRPRFGRTTLSGYVNIVDKDRTEQFSAISLYLPDDTFYVAFRGTDSSLTGWREDMALCYDSETAGQRRGVDYLNRLGEAHKEPLRLGGHSKGGNLAIYAAAFCREEIQERILSVTSHDGPGFREELVLSEPYHRIYSRLRHIVPEASRFGMLLSGMPSPRVVKSSAAGFVAHDGFTWEVERDRFVPGKLSETARITREIFGDWLEQMDDSARESFFDSVFTLLEATGEESLSAVLGNKWRSAEAMLASMGDLPKEKRKELRQLLIKLLKSAGKNAASYLT